MHLHHDKPGNHEHHGVRDALSSAGDDFRDALMSISGQHHPEHWEQVLEHYEHEHPQAGPTGS